MTVSTKSIKKYYWIKLKDDFFDQKEIKKLRKLAGGDTYTIIFLKLQLLSLSNNGIIYFDGLENNFEDEVALQIDEDPENVRVTIAYLVKIGWIEEISSDNQIYYNLIKIEVGSESASAARMRKLREHKKELSASHCDKLVTKCDRVVNLRDKMVTTEQELELETEIEKEQQQEKKQSSLVDNSELVSWLLSKVRQLNIKEEVVVMFIQKYGLLKVKTQLSNLQDAKNVRNNEAWLRSALEKNYATTSSRKIPDPDCPDCHGTGKIIFRVEDTGQLVTQTCKCLQYCRS